MYTIGIIRCFGLVLCSPKMPLSWGWHGLDNFPVFWEPHKVSILQRRVVPQKLPLVVVFLPPQRPEVGDWFVSKADDDLRRNYSQRNDGIWLPPRSRRNSVVDEVWTIFSWEASRRDDDDGDFVTCLGCRRGYFRRKFLLFADGGPEDDDDLGLLRRRFVRRPTSQNWVLWVLLFCSVSVPIRKWQTSTMARYSNTLCVRGTARPFHYHYPNVYFWTSTSLYLLPPKNLMRRMTYSRKRRTLSRSNSFLVCCRRTAALCVCWLWLCVCLGPLQVHDWLNSSEAQSKNLRRALTHSSVIIFFFCTAIQPRVAYIGFFFDCYKILKYLYFTHVDQV